MKFLKTVKKNLKLLIRAKSSAFIVLFGPLLIILLVGLALNKPSSYAISVGYYSPDAQNSLMDQFITDLSGQNYAVTRYDTNETCIEAIEQGTSHTCIVFPANFEAGNEASNKLEFYVDYSRANIVYQIIETVSEDIEFRTSELSKGLTDVLLTRIDDARNDIDKDLLTLITIKSTIDSINTDVQDTKTQTGQLNFSVVDFGLSKIKTSGGQIYNDARQLKNLGLDGIAEGESLAGNSSASLSAIEEDIVDKWNETTESNDAFVDAIDEAEDSADELKDMLDDGKQKTAKVQENLDSLSGNLESLKGDVNGLKGDLEGTNANLQNIDINDAEDIVSPIKTEIKPVITQSNQLTFFFPFLLVLVIMFIGIMLSSTLIIMEKNSKAAFRTFTTPTKDRYFVNTTFVTAFLILLVQILIILGLSYYFLKTAIVANIAITSLIVLMTISIFILIGMMIGYVTNTQEAATMLSIALGSVFLLLSNLILPIETMSDMIKNLTQFNPYVVSSEILRRTFLFKVHFLDILNEILYLGAILLVLIISVFVINKISRLKLLEGGHANKGYIYVPEDAYLRINNYVIKNINDVLSLLKTMSDEEFQEHVQQQNEVANWVSVTLKDRRLAWKLRKKSREKMIAVIEKKLEKERKKEVKLRKKFDS